MSPVDNDPVLELEELLDPTRLAAAWQVARERGPAVAPAAAAVPGAAGADPDTGVVIEAVEAEATDKAVAAPPARPAPLPVAVAHRRLLDELERTWATVPGLSARAERVLAAPLAQLAAVTTAPVDAKAAGAVLDDLEDVLQALLSAAGWPASGEE